MDVMIEKEQMRRGGRWMEDMKFSWDGKGRAFTTGMLEAFQRMVVLETGLRGRLQASSCYIDYAAFRLDRELTVKELDQAGLAVAISNFMKRWKVGGLDLVLWSDEMFFTLYRNANRHTELGNARALVSWKPGRIWYGLQLKDAWGVWKDRDLVGPWWYWLTSFLPRCIKGEWDKWSSYLVTKFVW